MSFVVFLSGLCNVRYLSKFCCESDLNWVILFFYANYIDQKFSAFLKMCIFGGVLSDINYDYLLMKLCEIIDGGGFRLG